MHITERFHMVPFWTALGGGRGGNAERWVGFYFFFFDGRIWGLGCGFPLLLAGDFCQTLVCRTRTNLEWPVAAEKNWPPRSRALGGKEGIIIPTHFCNFLPHIIEHLGLCQKSCLFFSVFRRGFEMLTSVCFYCCFGNENKDHADAAVHSELTEA